MKIPLRKWIHVCECFDSAYSALLSSITGYQDHIEDWGWGAGVLEKCKMAKEGRSRGSAWSGLILQRNVGGYRAVHRPRG